jgi:membrane protease YdiL (CAAX protease family)
MDASLISNILKIVSGCPKLVKKDMFCPNCQVRYKSTDFEFCRYCGGKLVEYTGEHVPLGKEETSKKFKHRTRASWGWTAAILVYACGFFLLFIFQNLMAIIGSYLYASSSSLIFIFLYSPIFQGLPSYIISYMIPAYRVVPVLGSTVITAGPELLVFITLGSYGLLVVPFLYLRIKRLSVKELGFDFSDKKEVRNDILVGLFGGSAMIIISTIVSLATSFTVGGLYSFIDVYLSRLFSSINDTSFMAIYFYQYVLLASSMILIVAPSEEISTRAFLQQGLENSWGRWIGLIVTAIIFSAAHIFLYPTDAVSYGFPSYVGSISAVLAIPSYLALALTLGILLQVRKYRILTTITAHAFYMIILVSIYYFSIAWISFY